MFILQLNDMRSPQVQMLTPVFRSESETALKTLIEMETVPMYHDGQWGKCFKQGGPLEWYNHSYRGNSGIVDAGTLDDWKANAAKAYSDEILTITELP